MNRAPPYWPGSEAGNTEAVLCVNAVRARVLANAGMFRDCCCRIANVGLVAVNA